MPKSLMITCMLLFFSLICISQKKLSYDGYYISTPDSTDNLYKYYLRFYPDGTVIGVNTAGKPDNLIPWFKKENKTPYKGKYRITDGLIHFSMTSDEGEVIYDGELNPDNTLVLLVKSMINNFEATEEYNFMKMESIE